VTGTLISILIRNRKLCELVITQKGLFSIIYFGIKDDIKETKKWKLLLLASKYSLITKAPTLEKTIGEAHDAVIRLRGDVELLKPLPQQVQSMQVQLNNIQAQVHRIPGVPK
jgi:hypothetical protein